MVDLAAGTGLFTRALEGRAGQVVAVEPDERMRHVLAARSPGVRVLLDEAMERLSRQHTVTMPEGTPFSAAEGASFGFARMISVDDTLEWLATASQVITADPAERAAGLVRSRTALQARAFRAGGAELVKMPMRSWCWRADRLPRLPLPGRAFAVGTAANMPATKQFSYVTDKGVTFPVNRLVWRPYQDADLPDLPELQATVAGWIAEAGWCGYDHIGELPHRIYENLRGRRPIGELMS